MSRDGASGCPQGRCRPQTVSRKGWTCRGSFSLHGQKRRRWRGVGSCVGGGGARGRQRAGSLSRPVGVGASTWSETELQCHGAGPDKPKSFLRLGVGGGGLGPLFKRLLRSTDACTSLMAARKEPRLPASSVVQLGGCRHHQGRGDPQCPGWTSGEEAVRDKPLVTDSVRPPQEPRQHAQGQSPEETHRSGYQWARVSIRQKPRLRTQEAVLVHGCSAHRAAVCRAEACPRPAPPSEARNEGVKPSRPFLFFTFSPNSMN